jgi:hypothetical protein
MASRKTESYSKEGISMMTTLTVVRVGLFALTIVALGFVPGVSVANPPSATGNGDFMFNGDLRTFSFSAIQQPNGNVAGQAEVHNRAIDTVIHMDIDCLNVVPPNKAFVSGTITKSNNTNFPVGSTGLFEVIDNGEGTNSQPDKLSPVFPGGSCGSQNTDLVPLIDILHGNIQVRPAAD